MKHTKFQQLLFTLLPLMSLVIGFGIVFHQYARRDQLKQELTEDRREYARLIKRYKELRHQELTMSAKAQSETRPMPTSTALPFKANKGK